ncbi:M48 family metalloprotease [Nocardia sp. NPDC058497]|uniref:M48 family metalloprotease n=1 Tax=Nocardia sp. NPDC058497 TaxID=3346529 RepID=UPI003658D52B
MSHSEPNTLSVTYRQGYHWAVADLLASLPSLVLSGWLLVGTAALLANWVAVLVAVLWAASGPVVLGWQRLMLGVMALSSERNLPDEHDRVNRAWVNVADAAGLPAATTTVWVMRSDAVNGAVNASGYVCVTRPAVEAFTERQLEALLAHELGHRLQGTATWRSVIRWYRWPFGWLVRAVFAPADWLMVPLHPRLLRLSNRVMAALRYSSLGAAAATTLLLAPAVLAYGTAACLLFAALALLLGPWGSALALALAATQLVTRPRLSQRCEYLADRVVVDLGYLDDFRYVLQLVHAPPKVSGPTSHLAEMPAFLATHPHLDNRLAAAERHAYRLR